MVDERVETGITLDSKLDDALDRSREVIVKVKSVKDDLEIMEKVIVNLPKVKI